MADWLIPFRLWGDRHASPSTALRAARGKCPDKFHFLSSTVLCPTLFSALSALPCYSFCESRAGQGQLQTSTAGSLCGAGLLEGSNHDAALLQGPKEAMLCRPTSHRGPLKPPVIVAMCAVCSACFDQSVPKRKQSLYIYIFKTSQIVQPPIKYLEFTWPPPKTRWRFEWSTLSHSEGNIWVLRIKPHFAHSGGLNNGSVGSFFNAPLSARN